MALRSEFESKSASTQALEVPAKGKRKRMTPGDQVALTEADAAVNKAAYAKVRQPVRAERDLKSVREQMKRADPADQPIYMPSDC